MIISKTQIEIPLMFYAPKDIFQNIDLVMFSYFQ